MLQNTEIKISFGIEGYSSTSHYLSSERMGEGLLGKRVVFRGTDVRISLRQRSIKYGQKKIDCELSTRGGAAGGRDHKNITEPCGEISKFYRGTTKIM